MFTLVPGSIVTGVLVTRTKNYQYPIWAGWSLTVIASGLTLLWDIGTPTGVWAITLVLLGLGHGAVLNAQNFASQAACKPGAESAAAAMYAFARQFGMAVGVGVGGSVFQNIFMLQLDSYGLRADGTARGQSNIAEILGAATDVETRARILHACVRGLHGVYGLYVGLSGAALLVSLPIRRFNMDRALVAEQKLQSSGDRSGDITHTT